MNLPNELRGRIDAYLDEVRSQSGLDAPAWGVWKMTRPAAAEAPR